MHLFKMLETSVAEAGCNRTKKKTQNSIQTPTVKIDEASLLISCSSTPAPILTHSGK
jgi:hypothetical protein